MTEENPKLHISEEKKNKFLKLIFNSITKQIFASFVILVVLFLLMNAPAYYQITKSKYQKITGIENQSPLNQLTGNNQVPNNSTSVLIPALSATETQQKQVPMLDLEIMPTTDRIVIPRINQNVPIIRVSSENLIQRDWKALERDIQDALRDGVVHYPGTSLPGENGNVVITGHSSYFPWDPGRFKDVFALLHDVQVDDRIVLYYNQKKFVYKVVEKFEIRPTQIEVLKQTEKETLTLITCTPIGTNIRRLIIRAEPIIEEDSEEISNKILR
jgi:LPXTG-site transpeptidase (sortase) family protein